ncbi:MAG: hypothetical protein ACKORY_10540, partial [Actinomycetota bacterium]
MWDKSRDDLVMRVVRRVGSLRIDERDLAPDPGDATTAALLARVTDTSMRVLGGAERAESLRSRAEFVRHHLGGEWPEMPSTAFTRSARSVGRSPGRPRMMSRSSSSAATT